MLTPSAPGVRATPPPELVEILERHGQTHLLRWWGELDPASRAELGRQIAALPLDRLSGLIDSLVRGEGEPPHPVDPSRVHPVAVNRLPRTDAERVARRHAAEVGEAALASGEVAVVIVAGGMGTRLGFDGPKGTFPIGPVSGASLFAIHAEKVVALSRRYGKLIPLYVMTSRSNHETTARFFAEHGNFGLDHVRFFPQGEMPALDRHAGRILMADKGRLALTPDGHGGALTALAAPAPDGGPSCLDEMRDRGIRTLFYFQVDNPLVRVADPAFLGMHRQASAEISFKVVEKLTPEERVGVVVEVDGRPRVIEYSDLAPELAEQREPDGSLRLWAGSIAIHVFERPFVERLAAKGGQLPFHRAVKKVPYLDDAGRLVQPAEPNAVKLELFIFDALPLADRWTLVETDRAIEFEPLKNATGPDSPATVRQRMSDLYAGWLEAAGAHVERRPDGTVPFGIEISPLYALDAAELKQKLPPGVVVEGPLYLR
jgi:UDP-N-acetylglucosamine/UDP-N-acetylgalactosamine diphosphorylase